MTTPIDDNILNELEQFHSDLKSYKSRQEQLANEKMTLGHWYRERDELRERLVRTTGKLKQMIIELTGKQYFTLYGTEYDAWSEAFNPTTSTPSMSALNAIAFCINLTEEAIGRLESDIQRGIRDEQGILIKKPVKNTEQKDTVKFPVQLFDSMQFHPKVIEVSRELFKDSHYRDAILRAFIEVNIFVKAKTGLELDGKALMAKVFTKDEPVIKLNESKTQSEKDEQEGFMFLFMGAMVGIRNPKAHDNIVQTDPWRTLEYLALASLLMKRTEEGNL